MHSAFPYKDWFTQTHLALYDAVFGFIKVPRKTKKKLRKMPEQQAVKLYDRMRENRINKMSRKADEEINKYLKGLGK